MKTDLTKKIEEALGWYSPAKIGGITLNKFRKSYKAFEVTVEHGTTTSGLIDHVRVDEYFADIHYEPICRLKRHKNQPWALAYVPQCIKQLELNEMPDTCNERKCHQYSQAKIMADPSILITCYEIKISKSDFKSKNGHNFVGNFNYYAVPKELYPEIKDSVPQDIGIVVYNDSGVISRKDATFKPMTDDTQKWMLLSVMRSMRR